VICAPKARRGKGRRGRGNNCGRCRVGAVSGSSARAKLGLAKMGNLRVQGEGGVADCGHGEEFAGSNGLLRKSSAPAVFLGWGPGTRSAEGTVGGDPDDVAH